MLRQTPHSQKEVDDLTARIATLRTEKAAVLAAVELEEEHMSNALARQLTSLQSQNQALERDLKARTEE